MIDLAKYTHPIDNMAIIKSMVYFRIFSLGIITNLILNFG